MTGFTIPAIYDAVRYLPPGRRIFLPRTSYKKEYFEGRRAMWRTGNRTRSLSLLALLAGQAANAGAPQIVATASNSMEILAPSAVDMSGATIGTITIENGSIFDLDNPAEDKALYRFANRAHVTTRADVIEAQLLFESGDEFSVQKIKESERVYNIYM